MRQVRAAVQPGAVGVLDVPQRADQSVSVRSTGSPRARRLLPASPGTRGHVRHVHEPDVRMSRWHRHPEVADGAASSDAGSHEPRNRSRSCSRGTAGPCRTCISGHEHRTGEDTCRHTRDGRSPGAGSADAAGRSREPAPAASCGDRPSPDARAVGRRDPIGTRLQDHAQAGTVGGRRTDDGVAIGIGSRRLGQGPVRRTFSTGRHPMQRVWPRRSNRSTTGT